MKKIALSNFVLPETLDQCDMLSVDLGQSLFDERINLASMLIKNSKQKRLVVNLTGVSIPQYLLFGLTSAITDTFVKMLEVNLTFTKLTTQSVISIFSSLSKYKGTSFSVNLKSNELSFESLGMLSSLFAKYIVKDLSILLSNNKITSHGLINLANGIAALKAEKLTLNLANNHFDDVGIIALSAGLSLFKGDYQSIALSGKQVTMTGMKALINTLAPTRNCWSLKVSGGNLGNSILEEIASKLSSDFVGQVEIYLVLTQITSVGLRKITSAIRQYQSGPLRLKLLFKNKISIDDSVLQRLFESIVACKGGPISLITNVCKKYYEITDMLLNPSIYKGDIIELSDTNQNQRYYDMHCYLYREIYHHLQQAVVSDQLTISLIFSYLGKQMPNEIIQKFPEEIQTRIYSFFSIQQLLKLRSVSKEHDIRVQQCISQFSARRLSFEFLKMTICTIYQLVKVKIIIDCVVSRLFTEDQSQDLWVCLLKDLFEPTEVRGASRLSLNEINNLLLMIKNDPLASLLECYLLARKPSLLMPFASERHLNFDSPSMPEHVTFKNNYIILLERIINQLRNKAHYSLINLSGTVVDGIVNWQSINLYGACLKDIDFENANLSNADIQCADLTDSVLNNSVLINIKYNGQTCFPESARISELMLTTMREYGKEDRKEFFIEQVIKASQHDQRLILIRCLQLTCKKILDSHEGTFMIGVLYNHFLKNVFEQLNQKNSTQTNIRNMLTSTAATFFSSANASRGEDTAEQDIFGLFDDIKLE